MIQESGLSNQGREQGMAQIIVKHKNEDRMTRWIWHPLTNNSVQFSIYSYINGYYQAHLGQEGIMAKEDWERNLEAVKSFPEKLEVVTV